MRPEVQALRQLLDRLQELYQQAIDVGSRAAHCEAEEAEALADLRQRICSRTGDLCEQLKAQEDALHSSFTPAERAFIDERKRLIMDMGPALLRQTQHTQRHMQKRLDTMRHEMASQHRQAHAIGSYLRSPASRPWVA